MPRPKPADAPEPKRRSRTGCWTCKAKKVKCGEEKPRCLNCDRNGEQICDYSIRLNWDGRSKRKGTPSSEPGSEAGGRGAPGSATSFGFENVFNAISIPTSSPSMSTVFPRAGTQSPSMGSPALRSPSMATVFSDYSVSSGGGSEFSSHPRDQAQSQPQQRSHSQQSFHHQQQQQQQQQQPQSVPSLESPRLHIAQHQQMPPPPPQPPSEVFSNWTAPESIDPALYAPSLPASTSNHRQKRFRHSNPDIPGSFTLPEVIAAQPHHHSLSGDSSTTASAASYFAIPPGSVSSHPRSNSSTGPADSHVGFFDSFQGRLPLTPSASSIASEDLSPPPMGPPPTSAGASSLAAPLPAGYNDARRMSVNSLLIHQEEQEEERRKEKLLAAARFRMLAANQAPASDLYFQTEDNCSDNGGTEFVDFGVDRGAPDLDLPLNDDHHVLDAVTPASFPNSFQSTNFDMQTDLPPEFGFGFGFGSVMPQGGHGINFGATEDNDNDEGLGSSNSKASIYSQPLQVRIPRALLPLPSVLLENPMNLMYFHFFREFTAKILVPHDCPQNPFRVILPQMAVRDPDLMNLLLAYSAAHRARLLRHPEPAHRIAHYVRGVFASLLRALGTESAAQVSTSKVAAAIMLASLEIVAPNAFGTDIAIPWHDHLKIARRLLLARGGARAIDPRKSRVEAFLVRWLAYLDVLGSFSVVSASMGSGNNALDNNNGDTDMDSDDATNSSSYSAGALYDFPDDEAHIDCLLGFPAPLAGLLARIADLARRCDSLRPAIPGHPWEPPPAIVREAELIRSALDTTRGRRYSLCPHRRTSTATPAAAATAGGPGGPASPSSPLSPPGGSGSGTSDAQHDDEVDRAWDALEMSATNDAFHFAALVHLHRRALGLPRKDPRVQQPVREIIGTIYKVRKGSAAEACLVFPIFTAGCEALDPSQRDVILERIRSVEKSGMTQVHKARKLMEKVWETGQPWEKLVQGEFFG